MAKPERCHCGSDAVELAYSERVGLVYCLACENEIRYRNENPPCSFVSRWDKTNTFFVFTHNHAHVRKKVLKLWNLKQKYFDTPGEIE